MEFEKTNWIIFNIKDVNKVTQDTLNDDEVDELNRDNNGNLYAIGVECIGADQSKLVVLDFLVQEHMIAAEVKTLKKSGALFYKEPFSDSEHKIVTKCIPSLKKIFPDHSDADNLRRIFNVAWSNRCSYPISSYDLKIYNTEASGSELQSLKQGDLVKVNFIGGKEGTGIFAGVSGAGRETRISVIWIETFGVPTFTETVTFYLGDEDAVPHSAIQKLEAA